MRPVYMRTDLQIWMAPPDLIRGHLWVPCGTLPIEPTGNLRMSVQLNPKVARDSSSTAGLLAEDEDGDRWICHTGRIGGGNKGIGQKAFVAWSNREREPVVDSRGKTQLAFPIARVGDPNMLRDIAAYVHEVAAFKENAPAPHGAMKGGPFGGADRESEGSTRIGARMGYTMVRRHAEIRNRLHDILKQAKLSVSRDVQRDIIVGSPKRPQIEFEIKPSCDSQSLYTAVGQLFMHSAVCRAKHRVLVAPAGMDTKRKKAIESLGIRIQTFTLTKTHIKFPGLDTLVPQVERTSIPR